jgi:hypothetical protein
MQMIFDRDNPLPKTLSSAAGMYDGLIANINRQSVSAPAAPAVRR